MSGPDRGSRLATMHGEQAHAREWAAIAEEIRADVLAHGVNERGVFTQRYGDDALDASLLLVPLLRFLPPDDPRILGTIAAVQEDLTRDGLLLRMSDHARRPEPEQDDAQRDAPTEVVKIR